MAKILINELSELGFTIHRYNAVTTNSIYLKLDFGVGAWYIERRGMKNLLTYDDVGKTYDVYISDKPPTFDWVQHTYF